MTRRPGFVVFPLLFALGACGSGSGESPIEITFNPASLTASYAQGEIAPWLSLTATLSRVPTDTVFVALVEDARVLASTQLSITPNYDGKSFSTTLWPLCTLAPGTYSGTFTLWLCHDGACQNKYPLNGNTLPYRFSVSSGTLITAAVDGVTLSTPASRCTPLFLDAKVGQKVELVANVPVTWSCSLMTSVGVPTITGLTTTTTTWSGVMGADWPYPAGTLIGGYSCQIRSAGMTGTWIDVNINVWG